MRYELILNRSHRLMRGPPKLGDCLVDRYKGADYVFYKAPKKLSTLRVARDVRESLLDGDCTHVTVKKTSFRHVRHEGTPQKAFVRPVLAWVQDLRPVSLSTG
jgi:hypothetical protein